MLCRINGLVGMVAIALASGCSGASGESIERTKQADAVLKNVPAEPITKEKATEIAKMAVMGREPWAKAGWPKEAFINVIDMTMLKPPHWVINVMPPPGSGVSGSHPQILVDVNGKVINYGSSW
jgi:hypothetical protein